MRVAARFLPLLWLWLSLLAPVGAGTEASPAPTPEGLPPALRGVDPEHWSSSLHRLLAPKTGWVRPGRPGAPTDGEVVRPAEVSALAAGALGTPIYLGPEPTATGFNQQQAEPHLARSYADARYLLATFQDGRLVDGGAQNCGYAHSADGGVTWSRAFVPQLSTFSGGPFFRATDPVAGFGPGGVAYLNNLVALDSAFALGAVVLSVSRDAGATFASPTVIYEDPTGEIFPDKNWMAVNDLPGTPTTGRVLVTWTNFIGDSAYPLVAAYSDDEGRTWSDLQLISGPSGFFQGSQPLFLPDGSALCLGWNFSVNAIECWSSATGGSQWVYRSRVATITQFNDPWLRDPTFLPSAAADRTFGHVHVAWQGLAAGNVPRIFYSRSLDRGATWSAPIAISDTPNGRSASTATLTVSPDGLHVTVVYYDKRNDAANQYLVDLYLAESFDGGASWGASRRVTPAASDIRQAQISQPGGNFRGYMLGDYLGIVPAVGSAPGGALWVDTRRGQADPWFASIARGERGTFANWLALRLPNPTDRANPALGGPLADPDGNGRGQWLDWALAPGVAPFAVQMDGRPTLTTLRRAGASVALAYESAPGPGGPWQTALPLSSTSAPHPTAAEVIVETATFAVPAGGQRIFRVAVAEETPRGAPTAH